MAYHENREYPTDLPITAVRFHNMNFLAHWHTEVEFVLVLEGRLGIGINSGYRTLETGDMAMFASGDIHYYDSKDNQSTVLIIVFRPEIIDSIVDLAAGSHTTNIIISKTMMTTAGLGESVLTEMKICFEAIFTELNGQKEEYKTLIKARLIELVGLFHRYQTRMAENAVDSTLGNGNVKLLQKAIRFINENYAHDISLEDISDHLNISPFYFSRIFSKSTGLTFKSYVNSYRIEKAQNLIVSTARPIIDIAYDCGFSSIRTFNRVFKSINGKTPSNVRGDIH
jgi:AraC-like DNA-binding protein